MDSGELRYRRRFQSAVSLLMTFACVLIQITHASAQDQKLRQMLHRSWTAKDGAPQDVKAMVQARDGTLWIGTAGGLYNFDGLTFTQFTPAPGEEDLQSSSIKSLLIAKDGALWVGMRQGGAARIVNGHITNTWKYYNKQPLLLVSFLQQDPSGRVWACLHSRHIVELPLGREIRIEPGPEGKTSYVKGLFLDRSGAMWAADSGHVWKRPFGLKSWTRTQVLGSNLVSLEELPDHTFWLVDADDTARGRRQHFDSEGNLISTVFDVHFAYATAPLHNEWNYVKRSGSGDQNGFSLERWEDGVRDVDLESSKMPDSMSKKDGLSGDGVFVILRDKDGNLWTGTDLGLDRFTPSRLVPYLQPGWNGSVICSRGGPVWIAATRNNGPLISVDNGIEKNIPGSDDTHFLNCGRGGNVWVVDHRGLWNAGTGRLTKTPTIPGWDAWGIGSFAQLNDHSLIASLRGAQPGKPGIWVLDHDKWSALAPKGPLPAQAWTMLADSQGRLWITSGSKIYLVQNGVSRIFVTAPPELGPIEILAETSHGLMFAATTGIAVIKGQAIQLLPLADRRLARGVAGLVESRDHDVWLNGAKGIVRVPALQIDAVMHGDRKTIEAENVNEGDFVGPASLTEHNPSAAMDGAGKLWFATINSVVSLDPEAPRRRASVPLLSVLSVEGDNRALGDNRKFPPHVRNLQIRYRGVDLTEPERTTYRYRLEGVDEGWQDAGKRTVAIYTGLKPRQYIFHVQAAGRDGVWTDTVSTLPFNITPSFSQTWWFMTLCVVAASFAIWLLLALRMRHLSLAIQRDVEQRADERLRIARELHDTLLQGVQGLQLSFHVAAQKVSSDDESRSLLERSLNRADQILLEGRNRVNDLRAEQVKDEELLGSIKQVAENLNDNDKKVWQLNRSGGTEVLRSSIADEMFYIAREALTNAFRHSESSEIVLDIEYGKKKFVFVCRDNGKGFDFEREQVAAGHWGLRGMRERATRIGATISAASKPDEGTEIRVALPAWRAYRQVAWQMVLLARLRMLFGRDLYVQNND